VSSRWARSHVPFASDIIRRGGGATRRRFRAACRDVSICLDAIFVRPGSVGGGKGGGRLVSSRRRRPLLTRNALSHTSGAAAAHDSAGQFDWPPGRGITNGAGQRRTHRDGSEIKLHFPSHLSSRPADMPHHNNFVISAAGLWRARWICGRACRCRARAWPKALFLFRAGGCR
jgi:hypothetical protein